MFERNASLDPAVFAFIEALPSIPTPDRAASPLRRARTLARLLADDAGSAPLLADAGAELTKRLDLRLDGLAAELAAEVETNVQDLLTTAVARTRITTVGEDLGTGPVVVEVATHARDVARDAQRIIDSVREGAGKAWFAHRLATESGASRDAVRVRCAALLRIEKVPAMIEATASDRVKDQLDRYRVQILNTVGATRDAYTRVQEQTTAPETVTVQLRQNERAPTKDRSGEDLPRFGGHAFSDAEGKNPVDLNEWERTVVLSELDRDGFVAWYRNPGTATPASLRIAYQNDEEEWTSLQPDFIVISRRTDGTLGASIIDPHGDYLAARILRRTPDMPGPAKSAEALLRKGKKIVEPSDIALPPRVGRAGLWIRPDLSSIGHPTRESDSFARADRLRWALMPHRDDRHDPAIGTCQNPLSDLRPGGVTEPDHSLEASSVLALVVGAEPALRDPLRRTPRSLGCDGIGAAGGVSPTPDSTRTESDVLIRIAAFGPAVSTSWPKRGPCPRPTSSAIASGASGCEKR